MNSTTHLQVVGIMSSSETHPFNQNNLMNKPYHIHRPTTTFRWNLRRPRRRLPTVRLGGDKKNRRGFFLARLCKRVKLRWLKMKYLCMLKKLKKYYESLVNDLIEGSRTIEAYQQRLLMETSFAIPVMGLSLNSYPSSYAADYSRPGPSTF